ncbi:Metastasis-associated protein MTA3 [Collichthys lucidus]|uniref:Metastasis-associated protein MTA3 n=1 Tax=Collichthys lucidus TaxID=240159 RepID=A0A4U5VFW8_COLLU|nr:Metastasis-associated protein MTA3 [Collichthys lucidus]
MKAVLGVHRRYAASGISGRTLASSVKRTGGLEELGGDEGDYVYFENSSSNPLLIRRIEELNKTVEQFDRPCLPDWPPQQDVRLFYTEDLAATT